MRSLRTEITSEGGVLAHLDLGGRFGQEREFGYRFNLAGERIGSHVDAADGRRHLLALAMDWRISRDSLLEVEFEHSRRSQPGVPGLSLLGNRLPAANPFININNQPWSQPGVMRNFSGSVRFEQALTEGWSWTAQLASQRLQADDRLAYPYGCYDAISGNYYADRYCPNGDYDLYDFRSDNERRTTQAVQLAIKGELATGAVKHRLRLGVQGNRHTDLGQPQADNNAAVGTGNLFTRPDLPADPSYFDPYTNLRERSTELFAYDAIEWTPALSTWLGLRHTRLSRDSVRTDGSRPTSYSQGETLPWLALTMFYRDQVTLVPTQGGEPCQIAIRPRLSTDHLRAMCNAALAGLGVGIAADGKDLGAAGDQLLGDFPANTAGGRATMPTSTIRTASRRTQASSPLREIWRPRSST